jgi:hypothetical protein
VKELYAQPSFERRDVLRDHGLRHANGPPGGRKAAGGGDFREHLQSGQAIQRLFWSLSPPLYKESRAFPGIKVRISDDIRKSVVFLGIEDDTPNGSGIRCLGTAFLLAYDQCRYLVTVKHVALAIADAPYLIRVNDAEGGGAGNLLMDETTLRWFSHSNPSVDLAVAPFEYDLSAVGCDTLLVGTMEDKWLSNPINPQCGDFCYTVGLFQFMTGKRRNLPVVHSGNIALLPSDELIPVRDWENEGRGVKNVEGYLVQSESVQGLSGAPVFTRHVIELADLPGPEGKKFSALLMNKDLALLGVWQGAWDAPPDEVRSISLRQGVRVPVGMGVVVPVSKLAEILEMPKAVESRKKIKEAREQANAASTDSIPIPRRQATDANPNHREDFNSMLTGAAKIKIEK